MRLSLPNQTVQRMSAAGVRDVSVAVAWPLTSVGLAGWTVDTPIVVPSALTLTSFPTTGWPVAERQSPPWIFGLRRARGTSKP